MSKKGKNSNVSSDKTNRRLKQQNGGPAKQIDQTVRVTEDILNNLYDCFQNQLKKNPGDQYGSKSRSTKDRKNSQKKISIDLQGKISRKNSTVSEGGVNCDESSSRKISKDLGSSNPTNPESSHASPENSIKKQFSEQAIMERWRGKLAVVTGAGSGIGAAIAVKLLEHGLLVAGLDLKFDGLTWPGEGLHKIKCDLMNGKEVDEVWAREVKALGPVHVLVNNAGITNYSMIVESERSVFQRLVDVNIVAMAHCASLAVSDMKLHKTEGHIFIINSVLGHKIPEQPPTDKQGSNGFNVYPATKHGSLALTESIRWELAQLKLPIKITSLSPGLVKTNIANHSPEMKKIFENIQVLDPTDIANSLIYSLSTPSEVEIAEMTVRRRGEFP